VCPEGVRATLAHQPGSPGRGQGTRRSAWSARPRQSHLGWQPSRFLSDRAQAERAFALAERLGRVNAAAAELGTTWPSLRKAFHRHGLGMPTRNPGAVRQRAIEAAHQRSGQPATPRLDPVFVALNRDELPVRARSGGELAERVRRAEDYAALGARVVVELHTEAMPRSPARGRGRSPVAPTAPTAATRMASSAASGARPTAPAAPTDPSKPKRGGLLSMPADPTRPEPRSGQQRFRADLVAYLDSLPVGELAGLLGELPVTRITLMHELSDRGPAWARLPVTWPQHPDAHLMGRRSPREVFADQRAARAARRAGPPAPLADAGGDRWITQWLARRRLAGAVAEQRLAEALRRPTPPSPAGLGEAQAIPARFLVAFAESCWIAAPRCCGRASRLRRRGAGGHRGHPSLPWRRRAAWLDGGLRASQQPGP
jgi:hypothetical protein